MSLGTKFLLLILAFDGFISPLRIHFKVDDSSNCLVCSLCCLIYAIRIDKLML